MGAGDFQASTHAKSLYAVQRNMFCRVLGLLVCRLPLEPLVEAPPGGAAFSRRAGTGALNKPPAKHVWPAAQRSGCRASVHFQRRSWTLASDCRRTVIDWSVLDVLSNAFSI